MDDQNGYKPKPEDFVERAERVSKNWSGESWTPDRTLSEFQLYGPAKRAEYLDAIDEQLRTADTANLRRYATLVNMRRQMDHIHHSFRKVGR